MEYALSYNNINKYIRLFLIYKIYTNLKNNYTNTQRVLIDNQRVFSTKLVLVNSKVTISTNIDILYKIISTNTQNCKFFEKNILNDLIILPNKSTGFIDNKLTTQLKTKFIKSLKLFLLNQNFGFYLMKYYYTIFFILHTYNSSIKHICTKIYLKANTKNSKTKQIYYSNLNSINNILSNLNQNYKFSYNDDNNYNLINNIINDFLIYVKKINIIQYKKFSIETNKNIYITLFQNIYNLQKNIIKKKS